MPSTILSENTPVAKALLAMGIIGSIALIAVALCGLNWFPGRPERRQRRAEHSSGARNTIRSAPLDADGWQAAPDLEAGAGLNDGGIEQPIQAYIERQRDEELRRLREEGLNELGEAPPPYKVEPDDLGLPSPLPPARTAPARARSDFRKQRRQSANPGPKTSTDQAPTPQHPPTTDGRRRRFRTSTNILWFPWRQQLTTTRHSTLNRPPSSSLPPLRLHSTVNGMAPRDLGAA
ncbi:hypothetical protein N657DRAFT_682168 [Parathielavia appendiculata]|uniref:Uncharacterized protein n=1 Tax=Parathielavia appendiculata TaxID=2587402 RepID=A0AAN6TYD0_9PEZI|nr:hypothetical protein N657DRAFT_682168 [Parathielavia appendiculata]